jgi:nitrate reductase gamma subunit
MMPQGEWFILMGVGGFFLLVGIGLLLWGRLEEKRIINALAQKPDLQEFTTGRVGPQPGSLKFGGWLSIAMGGLMLIVGIIFWLINRPQA